MRNRVIQRLTEEKLTLDQIKQKCGLSETEVIREMTRFWIENGIESAEEIALRIGLPKSKKARIIAAKAIITTQDLKIKREKSIVRNIIIKPSTLDEETSSSFEEYYTRALKNSQPFIQTIPSFSTQGENDLSSDYSGRSTGLEEQIYTTQSTTPRMIIHDVWFESKGRKNKMGIHEFSEKVDSRLSHNEIKLDKNCSLEAYIAKELFEIAQERKHQNVSIHNKLEAKTNNPINGAELESFLEVNFGDGEKRIIGIIDEDILESEYPINKFYRFADKENKPYNIEGCQSWSGDGKGFARLVLIDSIEKHILRNEKGSPEIRYLGLEGSSFNSYLSIAELAQTNGNGLEAIVVENNRRIANIMKSISSSRITHPETSDLLFGNVSVINSNIDHQILLDFANPMKFSLTRSGELDEKSYVSYASKDIDSEEKISLRNYQEMLCDIDSGADKEILKRKYKVSSDFIESISQRNRKKFNVVFLDYNMPWRKQNNAILDNLARTRLNDCSVVAITYNLGLRPGMNPGIHQERQAISEDSISNGDLDLARTRHSERINSEISKKFSKYGYKIVEFNQEIYNDNSEPMLFLCYKLEKENKND